MRTFALLVVLTGAALGAAAPVPQPGDVPQLVEKLGSDEFAEREAATKRLDELGAAAVNELRAACASQDPEVVARATDLVRKIERRASSERMLAPTLVQLEAKGAPLETVLAALSKQAGWEVVILDGPRAGEIEQEKVTVSTGKVPFWSAVLALCAAADLQIAGAAGFVAPGSRLSFEPRANGAARARQPMQAVVLEPRDGAKKRPGAVFGAVLVEAFEAPKELIWPNSSATVLQVWPEPRIPWQSVANLKITKALDPDSRKLTLDPTLMPEPVLQPRFVLVGRIAAPPAPGSPPAVAPSFQLNVRQAVAKFKVSDKPAPAARELTGSITGWVRSSVVPLATVTLDPVKPVTVTGHAGVEMTATQREADGKTFVDVTVSFPPEDVSAAETSDALDGAKTPGGNRTVGGVRVTDRTGAVFDVSCATSGGHFDTIKGCLCMELALELVVARNGPTVPAKVVFWGTRPKPVDVPFTLTDVVLK